MNAVQAAVARVQGASRTIAQGTGQVAKIRERHHGIARLIVAGIPDEVVCKTFGLSPRRLDLLRDQTPAFIELLAYYDARKDRLVSAVETYIDVLERNMIGAEQEIADRLAEAPDEFTVSELHKVSRDAADRLGFHKRTTSLNINADFASVLEAARRRSAEAKAPPAGEVGASAYLEAVALPAPSATTHSRTRSAQALTLEVTPHAAELHSRQVAAREANGEPPPIRGVLRRI